MASEELKNTFGEPTRENSSYKSFERIQVGENNPIEVVKQQGKQYEVVLGQYVIARFDTEEEAIKDAERTDIARMVDLMLIVADFNNKTQKANG